jgi:hypothetical protein
MTATFVLRRTVAIATIAALAALACAAPAPQLASHAPGPGRLIVAPLNLALIAPAELAGGGEPVWDELLRYLRQQDRPLGVLDASDAGRLFGEARRELERSGATVDPRSTAARFAELLAAQVDYGVLVMPSLVVRKARIGGYRASWDGVSHALPVRSGLPVAPMVENAIGGVAVNGYRGNIAAASLYVALFAPDGEPLYEGLAGLDLIQQIEPVAGGPLRPPRYALAPRQDSFADASRLREGIERAFERRLPASAR